MLHWFVLRFQLQLCMQTQTQPYVRTYFLMHLQKALINTTQKSELLQQIQLKQNDQW